MDKGKGKSNGKWKSTSSIHLKRAHTESQETVSTMDDSDCPSDGDFEVVQKR